MKYIEADKLKKIVEQAKQRALKGAEVDRDMYCDGRADAFEEVLLEIDSLQREQPVDELDYEKEIYKRFGQIKNFTFAMEVAKQFYELGCTRTAEMYDDIEYERQRAEEAELSGDLEEEIAEMYQALFGTDIINRKEMLYLDTFIAIARHFAEWGKNNLK